MESENSRSSVHGAVLASKMIVDERIRPNFMYREKRARAEDSGWRIFTGLESREYLDDRRNCAIYHPDSIIAVDPSIELLLHSGVGTVYEKNDENFWERVGDFKLEDDYMIEAPLDEGWSMSINNLFESSVEDTGEQYFTTGDKSLRVSVWKRDGDTLATILQEIRETFAERDAEHGPPLERFDLSEEACARPGYMIVENDERRSYQVIYGYTIIEGAFAFIALYFDDPDDLDWALATWKSLGPAAS